MKARGEGLAHIGRRRKKNEDCWLADDQVGLYIVADGMGGARGGEVASRTAVDAAARVIRAKRDLVERVAQGTAKAKSLGIIINEAFQEANSSVREMASKDPTRQGMGSTLTLLLVVGSRAFMGHVGDSRLYICRADELHCLSQDHTYAAELARLGAIKPEAVEGHPMAHILMKSIGSDGAVLADLLTFDLLPGDRLLLCSDGLANYVTDPAWLAKELTDEDLDSIPEELVDFANNAGGADNITALVVGIETDPEQEEALAEQVLARTQAIEGCPVFAGLSLARRARVLSHCKTQDHPAAHVFTREGQLLDHLFIVVSGRCTATQGEDVRDLGPGEAFGLTALLGERKARATVETQEDTTVLTLPHDSFTRLCRRRPRLGLVLIRRLARLLDDAWGSVVAVL